MLKIFVTGTRGIPHIPGGVESHCQQLYPLIVAQGHQVMLSRRDCYVKDDLQEWQGVNLIEVKASRRKSLEAIIHTLRSLWEAKKWGADIVHLHSIGPALLTPLARLMGLKVVFTNHGPDYDREKWGKIAKFVLRSGEKLGGIFANEVIVISNVIAEIIRKRCHRSSHLIFNGVQIPQISTAIDYLEQIGVKPNQYLIAVARFVPEKGLHDLIEAYNGEQSEYKLVIAGDADHEDSYSRSLKQMAASNPNIILTGYLTGEPLRQLFSYARLFVLPSTHEGLPIALLEALSYGLVPLVSDIPANLAVQLERQYYFKCQDIQDLRKQIKNLLQSPSPDKDKQERIQMVHERYNWEKIALQTIAVYEKVIRS